MFRKIAALNGHVTKLHSNPRPTNEIDEVMAHLKQLQESAATMIVGTKDNASDNDDHRGSAFIPTEDAGNEQTSVDSRTEESDQQYLTLTTELLTDGTTREHLIRHNKVNDMQWYYCNHCSKVKKPSDLIRHLRVHTKEKPFQVSLSY